LSEPIAITAKKVDDFMRTTEGYSKAAPEALGAR
jgi:hypothetical protein